MELRSPNRFYGTWVDMNAKILKLFIFLMASTSDIPSLDAADHRAEREAAPRVQAQDIGALVARNRHRGRSPAFVPERPRSVVASETELLTKARLASSATEAAALYGSAWRRNPTKARAAELRSAFARAHPGSELSDFVALKVADL